MLPINISEKYSARFSTIVSFPKTRVWSNLSEINCEPAYQLKTQKIGNIKGNPVKSVPITDAKTFALQINAKLIAINKLIPKKGLKFVQTPKENPKAISCGDAFKCFNLLIWKFKYLNIFTKNFIY